MTTLTIECPSRIDLSRAVFDALLDSDALGFLLSTKHFGLFLKHLSMENGSDAEALRMRLVQDAGEMHTFHQYTLSMYACIYIADAVAYSTEASLMTALDIKLAALLPCQSEDDARAAFNSSQLEMAWRYRRSCAAPLSER